LHTTKNKTVERFELYIQSNRDEDPLNMECEA